MGRIGLEGRDGQDRLGGRIVPMKRAIVAVTTGATGGGSPRVVPRTIIPEVKMPATGNALYVFALPERK